MFALRLLRGPKNPTRSLQMPVTIIVNKYAVE